MGLCGRAAALQMLTSQSLDRGTCGLTWQRDSTGRTEVKDLLHYLGRPSLITQVLKSGGSFLARLERCDNRRSERCDVAALEDG